MISFALWTSLAMQSPSAPAEVHAHPFSKHFGVCSLVIQKAAWNSLTAAVVLGHPEMRAGLNTPGHPPTTLWSKNRHVWKGLEVGGHRFEPQHGHSFSTLLFTCTINALLYQRLSSLVEVVIAWVCPCPPRLHLSRMLLLMLAWKPWIKCLTSCAGTQQRQGLHARDGHSVKRRAGIT